jgi:hypothetical protein
LSALLRCVTSAIMAIFHGASPAMLHVEVTVLRSVICSPKMR